MRRIGALPGESAQGSGNPKGLGFKGLGFRGEGPYLEGQGDLVSVLSISMSR